MSTKNKKQKKIMILAVVGILAGICAAGAVALAVFLHRGKNRKIYGAGRETASGLSLADGRWSDVQLPGRSYQYSLPRRGRTGKGRGR